MTERKDRRKLTGRVQEGNAGRSQKRSKETRTRLRGDRAEDGSSMITVTFNVLESQVDSLDRLADINKTNRSAILREKLAEAGI